jgi:TolB-like protein/Tfp pilus assembly protein PilF
MLAVLPFQNLTGEGDQDYVCDGLTEDVTSRLGALQPERLGVIARTSSNAYKRTTKRIDQIARELNVDYLLEGSFRPSGDRLRITAQLIATRDQAHVWTQQYEDDRSDLLQLCDSVAQSVTEQVRQRVVPAARASAGAVAVPPEARRAYLKGRYSLDLGTGAGFEAARDFFKEAIDREPNYAAAWAGLATTYVMLANYNMSPPAEAQPQAKAAATKALGLDPDVADARPVLAGMKMEHDWDFDAAEREFRRAISDNPNSARAHQWYGALLSALGRFDEGIDELRRAQELDPVALRVGVDVGRAYYFARRYDEAERAYRNVIALDPKYSSAHSMLGLALLARRRHSEAIAELEEGAALLGAARYSNFLGYAYALAGRTQDARAMLARQIDVWNKRRVGASGVALTYVGLGDEDQAFAWLDAARNGREAAVVMLKAFPYWDAIRTDPRFSDLLRRIGLPR